MQANLTQDHGGEQKNKLFQDQQVSETKSFVGSPYSFPLFGYGMRCSSEELACGNKKITLETEWEQE